MKLFPTLISWGSKYFLDFTGRELFVPLQTFVVHGASPDFHNEQVYLPL
jgi:hypothetical protein